MRILLKLLAAPVILVLMLSVWICSLLLYCSAFVFGLASTIIGLLGLVVLVTYSVQNGITLLAIAFMVSPMGLPMAAAWGAWKSAGFTVLDSGYDIWIKKMRNAFIWRSAFSYSLFSVAITYF